jgi:FemAB-related protein (PEP-CTERM system-associated)
MTIVVPLEPRDAPAWDDYVRTHPRSTFFHQLGWKRVLEATFRYQPCYLLARRGTAVVGALPLFACTSPGGRRLVSLPHSVYGGAIADDADAEIALLDGARAYAGMTGAGAIELRNRHAPFVSLPPLAAAVTFEKQLPARAADVIATLPRKSRAAVRQAATKHALEVQISRDLDTFYPLLAASYHRLGTPVLPRGLFERTLREFPREAWILFVGRAGEPPAAATLTLEFRNTLMPMWSGEAPWARELRPSNLMYLRLMELAVERGFARFDLGRTLVGNHGGIAFKRHQGFEPEPLPYQLDVLDGKPHAAIDPYRGWALRARTGWTRLPAWLVGWLGPSVVRFFP